MLVHARNSFAFANKRTATVADTVAAARHVRSSVILTLCVLIQ